MIPWFHLDQVWDELKDPFNRALMELISIHLKEIILFIKVAELCHKRDQL